MKVWDENEMMRETIKPQTGLICSDDEPYMLCKQSFELTFVFKVARLWR